MFQPESRYSRPVSYTHLDVYKRQGVYNICVQYCEFGWIGGSILAGTTDTRYGNAIQFWGTCSDSVIDHNWIYQVYDTAITHQYRNLSLIHISAIRFSSVLA